MLLDLKYRLSEKLTEKDKRALILGTGGSAKAVAWVLQKKGIKFLMGFQEKSDLPNQITYEDLDRKLCIRSLIQLSSTALLWECIPKRNHTLKFLMNGSVLNTICLT